MFKKRAILSVYDKESICELAEFLISNGYEIVSSGGTHKTLSDAGISVTEVSAVTGFPEILGGRVKTIHPAILAGILAKHEPNHLKQLNEHKLSSVDIVVVNLYPFEKTIAAPGVTIYEAIEQIDIGGPTLIRAAAKNHEYVTVLTKPEQYQEFMTVFSDNGGDIPKSFRLKCAVDVFRLMARYNQIIADYLSSKEEKSGSDMPELFGLNGSLFQSLRYGENPHQQAGFYSLPNQIPLGGMTQLHGKELSYNNILDLQAALSIISEFKESACVIIKHNNPCGVAVSDSLFDAHTRARSTDESSAFGGIISFNGDVNAELAESLASYFVECIIAPGFSDEALGRLKKKKNMRLLTYNPSGFESPAWEIKPVTGGFLVQTVDTLKENIRKARVVTKRLPSENEWQAMEFAWKLIKHIKSNAILFAGNNQTLGIGAGQMSRVDSTEVAILKSKKANLSLNGSAVASDAFFPFRDSIEALVQAGATAVIQPGGSIRDEEVIQAADDAGITMIFTGNRHFKH
ncbi:MAG: bifunctional phosphoribosylaminoimidazolecarboxamide formyltransferase/IMP cyclohydrolase [Calditrichaceae bacterium]